MTLTPGALLGPYEILTPLGSGGMGEVYRARDRRLDRQVAIKVLPQELTGSSQALERFQREARAASALNHPNICTVHDVGETSDHRQFLVMELLEGETLHDRLLRGALDIAQLLELGTSLVDALAAAHGAGIVHRDIKPANIFLVMRPGGSVVPKILDFGLAKVAADASAAAGATALETRGGSALTDPGSTVGTVAYMSPEQLRGEHLDVRTDLFSLGLVLYEMATGRPTFRGATSAVIAAAILDQEPVPPRQLRADLPARLEDVVLKALEKDREVRYQTASDLRADLRRVKRELDSHHGHSTAHVPDAGTLSAVTPALTNTSAATSLAQVKAESSDAQVVAALVKRHRGGLALGAAAIAIAVLAGGYYVVQQGEPQSPPAAAPASASFQDAEITQLTTSGNAAVPAITPDGKYVTYLQRDANGTSLWIRQTATASNVPIVAPQPGVVLHGAIVTPDSNFVDFLRTDGKDPGSLWRVPLLGGSPRRLIDDVAGLPGWSPDGRQMAFVRRQSMVVVADASGGNERVVLTANAPAPRFNGLPNLGSVSPAWSPDGRLIALVAFDNQGGGVRGLVAFVSEADGEQQIVEVSGIWGLAWLDSSSLVLSRAGGPGLPVQLWRLSYPRGELSRLTNDLSSYRGANVTSDRRTLVTARSDTDVGVWVADGAAGNGVELAPSALGGTPLSFYGMTWAADRLVYPTYSSGRRVLTSVSPDGAATDEIGLPAMGLTATSDGQTLAYASQEYSGFGTLWRADIDGRRTIQLVSDNSRYPVITPDDRSVLYHSNTRTGIRSLWIVPIDGGTPTQLVKGPLADMGIDVSPDGKSIAFISAEDPNRRMLVVCDLPACTARRTLSAPVVSRLRWTPDGRGIAYDGPGSNLWVLPLDDKPPRQLTRFTDGRTIADFAWSRDGRRLAVARATVKDDIVLFSGLQPGK